MPPSKSVVEPYRPNRGSLRRVSVLGVAMLVIFAVLLLRLWALQVLSGTKYVDQAAANSFRTVRVQAPRGQILDRNGVPLVTNAPATAILLWPADLPKVYTIRYAELRALAKLTRVPLYEIAAGIKARRDAQRPGDAGDRARGRERLDGLLPVRARCAVPGRDDVATFIRHYPYHSLAAQVLGYVGEISPTELPARSKQGYMPGDEIGQSGVESAYDTLPARRRRQRAHAHRRARPAAQQPRRRRRSRSRGTTCV